MQPIIDFFTQNPNYLMLILSLIGVLLFVGALLKWQWVLSPGRRRSFLRAIFGARGEMFVVSALLILVGIAGFIFI